MSRHEIPAKEPDRFKVIIGWDPPLLTFFAQVIDRTKEKNDPDDDKIVKWVGTSPREIYEIEDLARALRPYAVLDHEMRVILYGDKDEGR